MSTSPVVVKVVAGTREVGAPWRSVIFFMSNGVAFGFTDFAVTKDNLATTIDFMNSGVMVLCPAGNTQQVLDAPDMEVWWEREAV